MNNSPGDNLRFNQAAYARTHAHSAAYNAAWSAPEFRQPRLISWAKHAAVSFSMETKAHCVTEESRGWESSRGFAVPWKALGDEIVYCVVNRKREGGNCSRATITPSSFVATSLIFARAAVKRCSTNAHFTVTVVHSVNFRLYHRHDPACQMKLRVGQTRILNPNSCNPLYFLFVLCNPQYLILFFNKTWNTRKKSELLINLCYFIIIYIFYYFIPFTQQSISQFYMFKLSQRKHIEHIYTCLFISCEN